MTRIEFAIKTLRQTCPFDEELLFRIMDGDNRYRKDGLSASIEKAMGEYAWHEVTETANEKVFDDILYGMNLYIRKYRAIPAFKQKIWDLFNEWVLRIADICNIKNAKDMIG
ncbi:MAG: hypothetical protein K5886_11875, partial [Lachnospiraceae bacterium]|nr:hypothetical protein [Lachnospiraceae bacterium]